ncbi:hypothetical protein [Aquipuribacter hungaricus]|uniref:Ig-like domain-containing protein n=1 Tax=Aquipuribacter hungaricus TaxID=545624 RepID=A0ABV7WGI6_9MICO
MRRPAALVTAAVLAVGAFSFASPASADHIVTITQAGCGAGVFTGGFPTDVSTSRVSIRRDGNVVKATCIFSDLPKEYYNEEVGFLWTRVTTTTTIPVTGCALSLDPSDPIGVMGEGTATFTAGGAAKAVCVFELPAGA